MIIIYDDYDYSYENKKTYKENHSKYILLIIAIFIAYMFVRANDPSHSKNSSKPSGTYYASNGSTLSFNGNTATISVPVSNVPLTLNYTIEKLDLGGSTEYKITFNEAISRAFYKPNSDTISFNERTYKKR